MDRPTPTVPQAASAMLANWLASNTFFPSPTTNRQHPAEKSAQFSRRWRISSAMVEYFTMGPAMSWGKKEIYSPRSARLRWTRVSPRATSKT